MPVLKAPPQQQKNETVQLRLSQSVKFRLARYAEFIHASPSYIVTEMLERLFRKDVEFQRYLASSTAAESENNSETVHSLTPVDIAANKPKQ
jgi:hypothetical protein